MCCFLCETNKEGTGPALRSSQSNGRSVCVRGQIGHEAKRDVGQCREPCGSREDFVLKLIASYLSEVMKMFTLSA